MLTLCQFDDLLQKTKAEKDDMDILFNYIAIAWVYLYTDANQELWFQMWN